MHEILISEKFYTNYKEKTHMRVNVRFKSCYKEKLQLVYN